MMPLIPWDRSRLSLANGTQSRIGLPVLAAVPLTVTRTGFDEWQRKGDVLVLALTAEQVYLLELYGSLLRSRVGGVVDSLPREGLVLSWDRRWMRIRAELSWPDLPAYIAGWTRPGPEADKLFGLLTTDAFERSREAES
jgi:hypothetical protein